MSALYDIAVAAFDEAEWDHTPPNGYDTLGTKIEIEGHIVGGSLLVRDGVVRYLAFGVPCPPGREAAFNELFAVVNTKLAAGSFELDEHLGPVCRAGADLSFVADDDGGALGRSLVGNVILGLATTATGLFEGLLKPLEAVAAGADPVEVLNDPSWRV